MKAISQSEFEKSISSLPIKYELCGEGTVRLTFDGKFSHNTININCDSVDFASSCLLIGRESTPPLEDPSGEELVRNTILVDNRIIKIDTKEDLVQILGELSDRGWCVDNDAYIVDCDGKWIIYASHHGEIDYYRKEI